MPTEGRTFGVLGGRIWRLADLGAQHAFLVALGLGTYATSRCRRGFGGRTAGADQTRGSAAHDYDDARDLSLGYQDPPPDG